MHTSSTEMSTKFQSGALCLYKTLFKPTLYPSIFDFDQNYKNLVLNRELKRCLFFGITFTLNISLVLACIHDVTSFFAFGNTGSGMNVGIAYLLVVAGLGLSISLIVTFILVCNHTVFNSINRLMMFKLRVFQGIRKTINFKYIYSFHFTYKFYNFRTSYAVYSGTN